MDYTQLFSPFNEFMYSPMIDFDASESLRKYPVLGLRT